ncbi:MAG: WXG100 family type VII secretion target [Chloroflexi bacterium]|nr:WXG100 family type VII secretion target [Chloroflexota bacterium]
MPADRVEVNYELLSAVGSRFQAAAQRLERLYNDVTACAEELYDRNWSGDNADAFIVNLADETLPGLERLIKALLASEEAVLTIQSIMAAGEDEAAAIFRSDAYAGAGFTAGPPRVAAPLAGIGLGRMAPDRRGDGGLRPVGAGRLVLHGPRRPPGRLLGGRRTHPLRALARRQGAAQALRLQRRSGRHRAPRRRPARCSRPRRGRRRAHAAHSQQRVSRLPPGGAAQCHQRPEPAQLQARLVPAGTQPAGVAPAPC